LYVCTSEVIVNGFVGVAGGSRRERLEKVVRKRLIKLLPLRARRPVGEPGTDLHNASVKDVVKKRGKQKARRY